MASNKNELHFVLFPFFAPGHMIPMFDIAKLLAQHGASATIVTTPHNKKRFCKALDHAGDSGLQIQFAEVPFPSKEFGFPEDCENFDMLPSLGLANKFYDACNSTFQEPVEKLLRELKPKPICIISDMQLPGTIHVARKLGIPRVSFNGFSAFSMLCMHHVFVSGVLGKVSSDSEYFSVPNLPGVPLMMTKNQLPQAMLSETQDKFAKQFMDAEGSTFGVIINSFDELESAYVQEYKKVRKSWCIGPVSLCNKDSLDKLHRGKESAIEESKILQWLDSQKPGTVIYASLGSLCNVVTPQLIELGLGLEASNRPFIWVVKGEKPELTEWLEDSGFEERTRDRGLVVRGWAPQLVILSHGSVGGFLTHCGWNSTLEGICSGKPMVTWPLFADQFCNEKLVAEVVRTGVKVGAEVSVTWGEEDKVGVTVRREDVKKAIDDLMDEESGERRRRAEELCKLAKEAAMEGGSSYCNMELFLKEVMEHKCDY